MTPEEMADLVVATRNEMTKLKFVQAAQNLRRYAFLKLMWRKMNLHKMSGGIKYEFPVLLQHGNNARMVELFENDVLSVTDGLAMAQVPLRHWTANWTYEYKAEQMNSGKERLYHYVKGLRLQTMLSKAALLEEQAWGKPANSSDTKSLWGMQYWLVPNASTGFNGGNPEGFDDKAGIDASDDANARWRNYTATYTDFTKDDFREVLALAKEMTNFESPPGAAHNDLNEDTLQYVMFSTYAVQRQVAALGEAQNQNLGRDVDSIGPNVLFQKNPILTVPILETAQPYTGTIYMVNLGTWKALTLDDGKGKELPVRETDPVRHPNKHDTWVNFQDGSLNLVCQDPRRNAVIYQA